MTTISQRRPRSPEEARLLFAAAVREQRCMICMTDGDGPLVRVRVIRRADGARTRALVCEGCVPEAPARYAVLRVIAGAA